MASQVPNGLRVFVDDVLGRWYSTGGICIVHHGPGWLHMCRAERQGPEAEHVHGGGEPPRGIETDGGGIAVGEGAVEAVEGWETKIGLDGEIVLHLY